MVVYKDGNPFAHLHLAEDVELGAVGAVAAPIGGVMTAGASRAAGGALLRGGAGVATGAVIDGLSLSSADAIVRGLLGQDVDVTELGVTALTGAAGSAVARGGTAALNRPGREPLLERSPEEPEEPILERPAGEPPAPLLERPPDVGLSDRGVRPEPGTRTMTREQWDAERARPGAERRLDGVDRPLEFRYQDGSTSHGHGHARHGGQTTDAQQEWRALTKQAPDGSVVAGGRASRFRDARSEVEALMHARAKLREKLKAGLVPGQYDPTTGRTRYVNAAGQPRRVTVVVRCGRPEGYADRAYVAQRESGSSSPYLYDDEGHRIVVVDESPQMHASVTFEYVPSLDEWHPLTYFPEP
jgi:hypothetical protein